MKKILIIALSFSLTLYGCATQQVAFQQDAKKGIKKIAIIQTPEPERYIMFPAKNQGTFLLYMFGAIGGAIAGGIEGNRIAEASKNLTAVISPYKPGISLAFQNELESGLKAKGYEVVLVPAPPLKKDGKTYDLERVDGDFDAYVIAPLNAGYYVFDGRATPQVGGTVSVSGKSGDPKYFSQNYAYSARNIRGWFQISPDPKSIFDKPEAVFSNAEAAAQNLKVGAIKVADQVLTEF